MLACRLGTADAVVMGSGSMIGAGIFAALGPGARAAWLIVIAMPFIPKLVHCATRYQHGASNSCLTRVI